MQNIERKLETTFGKKNDLESRLMSASSNILTQKIDFQESSKPHSSMNDMLKDKYVKLAPGSGMDESRKATTSLNAVKTTADDEGEGLPHPKVILFQEPLDFKWDYSHGTGLVNCGNTCFLNAVLQCLIHTPPLTNYMMSSHHTAECQMLNGERCILCNLEFLTKRTLTSNMEAISPKWFTNNLQYIGRHFRNGRQEDAHEFLRLSLEKMQKCALYGQNHLDKYSKETTVVNKIFGGFLRSQVQCVKCGHRSNTYDPLLDISLDIKTVSNLQQALNQFVAPDKLDAENAYKCERCKQKVTAFKRFTIHKAPNVLTIQLKRFQYGSGVFFGGGSKIHKPIQYPLRLNLRPIMSNKNGPPMIYSLIGSIQHEGYSCTSGHYVANVRCGDKWYNFNDSNRRLKHVSQCLNEESAYILFYMLDVNQKPRLGPELKPAVAAVKEEDERKKHQKNGSSHVLSSPKIAATFSKPVQLHQQHRAPYVQTAQKANGFPCNEIGVKVNSPFVPLPVNREKIFISLKPKTPEKRKFTSPKTPAHTKPSSPSKSETVTPRLVMKIKDGKSITIETSPDGERRILSDDDEVIAKMNEKHKKYTKKLCIVPYGNNSDSDWSSDENPAKRKVGDAKKVHGKENGSDGQCGVVLDRALNTTTSVPGNSHLLNMVSLKDKVSHSHSHHVERPKDIKMFSTKPGCVLPVRRQLSDSISCNTSPLPAKHSGTGEWHTSAESVLSPSIGSNHSHGSNHSSSSTHDWSVLNGRTHTNSQERKPDGWTVTECNKDDAQSQSSENKPVKPIQGKPVVINEHASPYVDVSDRIGLLKQDKPKDKNSEAYKEYKRLKKLRKKHKRKHHEVDHNYSGISPECNSHSHKKKKKKHKKEKYRDSKHRDSRENRHQKLGDNEEDGHGKYRESREDRHSKHGDSVEDRHAKHRASEKETNTKHRDIQEDRIPKYKQEEIEEQYQDKHKAVDHDKTLHHQKHREDRHREDRHRHKEERGEERFLKRRHERDIQDRSYKRHRTSSESSTEFEWVEKTVPARASVSEPVTPSHRWDHHIKDSYKSKTKSGSSTPLVSTWDGLKMSTVVQELEKVSSYSYGAPVSGWDGQKCQLDTDSESRKRKESDDEYDDEYDRGKVKKVKVREHSEHRYNGNVFQQRQDQLNNSKIRWNTMKIGNNNPFKAGH